MQEGLYIAASGGMIQQRKLEVLANNLANINTNGFKQDSLVFHEMLTPFRHDDNFEAVRNELLPPSLSNKTTSYVALTDFATNFKQGGLTTTGNPLDLALEGDGFFAIQTEQGIRYTRKGNFALDDKNRLVNPQGQLLLSRSDQGITIPPNVGDVTVDPEGAVSVSNGTQSIQVGQLKLVQFEDKSTLVKDGSSFFKLKDGVKSPESKAPPKNLGVRQGFVESSNVNVVDEMTRMITTSRTFEAFQKVIQSIDSANDQSINSIARVV